MALCCAAGRAAAVSRVLRRGTNDSGKPVSRVEYYDPNTDKWEKCASLCQQRASCGMAAISSGSYITTFLGLRADLRTVVGRFGAGACIKASV